jgi:hypothetical protein
MGADAVQNPNRDIVNVRPGGDQLFVCVTKANVMTVQSGGGQKRAIFPSESVSGVVRLVDLLKVVFLEKLIPRRGKSRW